MRITSRVAPLLGSSLASIAVACAISACGGGTTGGTSSDSGPEAANIILPPRDAGTSKHMQGKDASAHDARVDTGVDAGFDAGVDSPVPPTDAQRNTFPAFKPAVPQVQNFGGPVLANPIFVPVIFVGDMYQAQIEAFIATVGQSQYWTAAVSEYGVHAGVTAKPIILDETMPSTLDDGQLQTWLANRVGTDPRFGALPSTSLFDGGAFDAGAVDASAPISDAASPTAQAPANVVYTIFFPSGTTITMGGGQSCAGFGGYHNSSFYPPNGSDIVYAVIPRCGNFGGFGGFDTVTATTSHELAEAVTDPFVGGNGSRAAYGQVDEDHFFWEILLGGGEVGDMCAQFPGAFYHPSETSMASYLVQRIWSNHAAAAGQDPCVPALTAAQEPYYFNTVPNVGHVTASYRGFNFSTLGVSAPLGQSTTIELDLFSSASTKGQSWQVKAYDGNAQFTGSGADLIFAPSVVQGANGDKLQVAITNLGNDGQTARPLLLISSQGDQQNWWIGVVTN